MAISKKRASAKKARAKKKASTDAKAKNSDNGITQRDRIFIEGLLEGKTKTKAARDAGYSESVSLSRPHQWIGETREKSEKPLVFDEYHKRLKEKLRLHDVTVDNVLHELKIIGFSSLDHFLEFPSLEQLRKERKLDALTRRGIGILTEQDEKFLNDESIQLKDYRPGSTVKLKNYEDIPKELIPAIAEISETKEGIRLKLHSKLDAIDKLCRYLKIYESEPEAPKESQVTEINIHVNGSKSPLLGHKIPEPARKTG